MWPGSAGYLLRTQRCVSESSATTSASSQGRNGSAPLARRASPALRLRASAARTRTAKATPPASASWSSLSSGSSAPARRALAVRSAIAAASVPAGSPAPRFIAAQGSRARAARARERVSFGVPGTGAVEEESMASLRQRTHELRVPAPDRALPGRAARMRVAEKHFVLGHPLVPPFPEGMQQAVFGMGCFWGAEKRYWQAPGVYTTAVGYAGGTTPNPTYEEVCSGLTG